MPILCTLGQHHPSSEDELWNKGWYFTRCTRCGANLVRTGSGQWHVPKGKQVVWRERTPRGRKPEGPPDAG